MLAALNQRCPGVVASQPLAASDIGAEIVLESKSAQILYGIAFADAAGGAGAAGQNEVVWTSGGDELLVRTAAVRLGLADGYVLVQIPVYSDQTQDDNVVVPFAVGTSTAIFGMIMATETLPRGPAIIVRRWGDHLVAAAWQALIHVAAAVAGAAGVDDDNQPLLPGAISASANGLTVLPQARHPFDRRATA